MKFVRSYAAKCRYGKRNELRMLVQYLSMELSSKCEEVFQSLGSMKGANL